MSARRLQLKGASLQELKAQVLAEHGPDAKIVAAEKVTVGGIRGFFAREHYEVTVELPAPSVRGQHALDQKARAGIAALLADAELAESQLHGSRLPGKAPELQVSTHTDQFAVIMDNLTFNTARPTRLPKGAKLEEPGTDVAAQGMARPEAGHPEAGTPEAGTASTVIASGAAPMGAAPTVATPMGAGTPGAGPTGAANGPARPGFGRRRTDPKPQPDDASESAAAGQGQGSDAEAAGTAGASVETTAAANPASATAHQGAYPEAAGPAPHRPGLADGEPDVVAGTVVDSGILPAAGPGDRDEARQVTGPGSAAVSDIPAPLYGPGDLVLVIGQGSNALEAANAMAAAAPAVNGAPSEAADWISSGGNMVRMAGSHAADVRRPVQDRNSAIGARARGVERGQSVFVAFGLGNTLTPPLQMLAILPALGADQIWLAVDAGRKAEDTDRWVQAVQRVVVPDGLAVTGSRLTSTPKTVNTLGVPVGWIDGAPSEAAWL
ncbi:hypothetical protein E4J89_04350 [Arthrobacter sp. CAU 1506]|uniref:hypothetical protein n=1 Tax=Arthrobacter sp. CAU 1506 TaxID=2560052 RepID=UPI0010AD3653|nr:hypothetical protein [Arthrobacter sp. CAU 1506]TJY71484.1 hypothetical protein E4J89_04350 [Arthrobacter sp. CAU 1506]